MKYLSRSACVCVMLTVCCAAVALELQRISSALLQGEPMDVLRDQEWVAYRGYYEFFVRFRDIDQPRHYPSLRLRLKIWTIKQGLPFDGIAIQLVSASVDQRLHINPISGTELPLFRQAFEEDAVLRLNRAKGGYSIGAQYSIQIRQDGVYTPQWLRSACEQGLMVKKTFGLSHRLAVVGKSCTGVTFLFPTPGTDMPIVFKDAAGMVRPLATSVVTISGTNGAIHATSVSYKFHEWPQQGQLLTRVRADLIDFIVE